MIFREEEPGYAEWQSPPEFTTKPADEYQAIGKSVTFGCAAKGAPEPAIIWTKNGKELPEFYNQEFLNIDKITPEDVGVYACNATNNVGYAYEMAFLDILNSKPFFLEKPRKSRQAAVGQEVFMRCSVSGFPEPTITWLFDNQVSLYYSGHSEMGKGPAGLWGVLLEIFTVGGQSHFYGGGMLGDGVKTILIIFFLFTKFW